MKALMIVGSPKPGHSTSEKIGNYVLDRIRPHGWSHETANASRIDGKALVNMAENADLILISYPLYVDALPAPLTKACEILVESLAISGKKIAAIANSGFPEPKQNFSSLDILKSFSSQAGLEWIGGVAVGGGGALSERKPMKLEEHGGMAMKLMKTLDLLASAIVAGKPFGAHLATVAQPLPFWVYTVLGDYGWRSIAKKRGIGRKDMLAKPLWEPKP
jgi:multimeric flavodoxin WrbA